MGDTHPVVGRVKEYTQRADLVGEWIDENPRAKLFHRGAIEAFVLWLKIRGWRIVKLSDWERSHGGIPTSEWHEIEREVI